MAKPCYSLPMETESSSTMKTESSPAKPASKGPMVTKNPVSMSKESNMGLPLISGRQDIGRISIMIMVTKPAKLFSAELPAQYEMVQRKMANGMAQPILPVKMVK